MTEETRPGLQYPCLFPLKIIGVNHPDYMQNMADILLRHVPDFNPDNLTSRTSSMGKYLSLSVVFMARDQNQVDNLYRELTAHPDVKWVL